MWVLLIEHKKFPALQNGNLIRIFGIWLKTELYFFLYRDESFQHYTHNLGIKHAQKKKEKFSIKHIFCV